MKNVFQLFKPYLTTGINLIWMTAVLVLAAAQNEPTMPNDVVRYYQGNVWQVVLTDPRHGDTRGSGSGFFISENKIITNCHVARGGVGNLVTVVNHNASLSFPVTIDFCDEDRDIAQLHCECGGYKPWVLPLLDGIPRLGAEVFAGGYGLGAHLSLTRGFAQGLIYSGLANENILPYPGYFSSVSTVPGDSGSAMIVRGAGNKLYIAGVRSATEMTLVMTPVGYIGVPVPDHALIISNDHLRHAIKLAGKHPR